MTPAASAMFRRIFTKIDFEAAIRLGTRPGDRTTEHFIDFIHDSEIDPFKDVVYLQDGVKLVVERDADELFQKIKIDYIAEPSGFIFETEGKNDG
jgi:Fe-S cluster assembly iron-binding protein IscA